jgi:hypothetical protein
VLLIAPYKSSMKPPYSWELGTVLLSSREQIWCWWFQDCNEWPTGTKTVEDYTTKFQALQFDITMHNSNYDDMFFTHKYIMGLKEDINGTVEA